jgi:hypothetical protein
MSHPPLSDFGGPGGLRTQRSAFALICAELTGDSAAFGAIMDGYRDAPEPLVKMFIDMVSFWALLGGIQPAEWAEENLAALLEVEADDGPA